MKVFVVIVTYKGHRWYQRCFDSLRHSEIAIQTIVIDNASDDGTVEYIEKNYPEIHLIKSDKNLGFGQGNNIGLKYAVENKADYVFLLNQDAWIEPNSIAELIRINECNPEYGILGPMLMDTTQKKVSPKFEAYFSGIYDSLFVEDIYFNRTKDIYNIRMLPAAVWLISKKVLLKVGGFDPIFYHYGEDDHYVQRTKYYGYKIGFCPKVRVVHDSENFMLEGKLKFVTNSAIMRRVLLLEWVDINKNFMFLSKFIYYTKYIIKQLVMLRFTRARILFEDLLYLFKMNNAVAGSRALSKNAHKYWNQI